ncbi:MAG TPA: DsbA family protein [Nitrospirales bacterium]|nr:DsbA family protein [Nitrospirales bacterium]
MTTFQEAWYRGRLMKALMTVEHMGYASSRWRLVCAFTMVVSIAVSISYGAAPIWAGDGDDLRRQLDTMRSDLDSIKQDVQEIRKILERARGRAKEGPVEATVSIDDDPMMGNRNAQLTLIEFSDYHCPFCRRFFTQTFPKIKSNYIDTGKVRYVFRDYPLDAIHPHARKAAETAHCAQEQGKYWEMHDAIFESKDRGVPDLNKLGHKLGLDVARLDGCVDSGKYGKEIEKDYQDGTLAGVTGTPGFFLGLTRKGATIEGTLISGAQPFARFTKLFDALLASQNARQ